MGCTALRACARTPLCDSAIGLRAQRSDDRRRLGVRIAFLPSHSYDLSACVRRLTDDARPPGLPEWQCLHTPGHTHGHISLYRESDRTLIAGDALATMDVHSLIGLTTREPQFCGPLAPFTADWNLAESSLHALAALRPRAVLAGHGRPICGDDTADRLHRFADVFRSPAKGRYADTPARADTSGIIALPPPVPDPLPKPAVGFAVGVTLSVLLARRVRSE